MTLVITDTLIAVLTYLLTYLLTAYHFQSIINVKSLDTGAESSNQFELSGVTIGRARRAICDAGPALWGHKICQTLFFKVIWALCITQIKERFLVIAVTFGILFPCTML